MLWENISVDQKQENGSFCFGRKGRRVRKRKLLIWILTDGWPSCPLHSIAPPTLGHGQLTSFLWTSLEFFTCDMGILTLNSQGSSEHCWRAGVGKYWAAALQMPFSMQDMAKQNTFQYEAHPALAWGSPGIGCMGTWTGGHREEGVKLRSQMASVQILAFFLIDYVTLSKFLNSLSFSNFIHAAWVIILILIVLTSWWWYKNETR